MPGPIRRLVLLLGALSLLTAASGAAQETDQDPPVLRDGFESGPPSWREEATDATALLQVHERSDRVAHEGRLSERFVFEAGPGSALYYSYSIPRTAVVETLEVTLYCRSNRPGVQVFGRVVLPNDREAPGEPPTRLLVAGTLADTADRWQRLELVGVPLAVERQARVLRVDTGREVSLEGAYLEAVVVNLYGGPGASEVFLDELTIQPVGRAGDVADSNSSTPGSEPAGLPDAGSTTDGPRVKLVGTRLTKDGYDWFPRMVYAPGADLDLLHRAGFDVLVPGLDPEQETLDRARRMGFLLAGDLSRARTGEAAARGPEAGASDVAFWNLGDELGEASDLRDRAAELERVRSLIRQVRELPSDCSRLTAGTVGGLFPQYAQFGNNLDLIGVEIPGPGVMQEPIDLYQYLVQRRTLTATRNPNGFFYAWVPASSPSAIRSAVWGLDVPPAWGWPQALPEQIRIDAYAALSAGYRGLGFRGDADLTSQVGLSRLYEASLLIAEIAMVEAILARGGDPIPQLDTFPPDPKPKLQYNTSGTVGGFSSIGRGGTKLKEDLKEVKAHNDIKVSSIELGDGRTKLLIVTDFAAGAQFIPSKMAEYDLNLLVPGPESAQAFELTLGGLKPLTSRRDAGGRRVVIPTFDTTALVLLTTDLTVAKQIDDGVIRGIRPRAVEIAIRQAELQLQEVTTIHNLLLQQGLDVRDSAELLAGAADFLKSARSAQERQDFALAWTEARTVGQALRMLMRAHWGDSNKDLEKLLKDLARRDGVTPIRDSQGRLSRPAIFTTPVSCPPLLCWQTLPQYSYWRECMAGQKGPFGPNRVPTGSFDNADAMRSDGWSDASHRMEDLLGSSKVVRGEGWGPRPSSLKLTVEPASNVDEEQFRKADGTIDEEAYKKALFARIDSLAPFVDHPVSAVKSPGIPVRATNFVRIRVLVRMPQECVPGTGGLIVRDSIGGEALQFRMTQAIPGWREVILFRRAPADGEVSVMLGLAGYGDAYFDELRVEILGDAAPELASDASAAEVARELPGAEPPSPTIPRR